MIIGNFYISCSLMDNWQLIIHPDKWHDLEHGYTGIYYFIGVFAGFIGWRTK